MNTGESAGRSFKSPKLCNRFLAFAHKMQSLRVSNSSLKHQFGGREFVASFKVCTAQTIIPLFFRNFHTTLSASQADILNLKRENLPSTDARVDRCDNIREHRSIARFACSHASNPSLLSKACFKITDF